MKIEDIKQALENKDLSSIINSLTTDMLNLVTIDGEPLINKIVKNRNMTIQALHLMNQEMLTIQDDEGWTPVHYAATLGHLDQIKDMLTPEMLTTKDKYGWTPVHRAAYNGHLDQIKDMLTPKMLTTKSNSGWTPVHAAAENVHLDQIKDMLTKEMLTIKDIYGSTPVHEAAHYGLLDQIKDMLTKEMLTIQNNNGKTPLDLIEYTEKRKEIQDYVNNKINNKPKTNDEIKALHEKLDLILKKLDQKMGEKPTKPTKKGKPKGRTE